MSSLNDGPPDMTLMDRSIRALFRQIGMNIPQVRFSTKRSRCPGSLEEHDPREQAFFCKSALRRRSTALQHHDQIAHAPPRSINHFSSKLPEGAKRQTRFDRPSSVCVYGRYRDDLLG